MPRDHDASRTLKSGEPHSGEASVPVSSAGVHSQNVHSQKKVLPGVATEGVRDPEKLTKILRGFVVEQPYGKSYKDLAPASDAPEDSEELGAAKTHSDLKRDQMEMQAQFRYLQETKTEVRFGAVVILGARVFRYGTLKGVQIAFGPVDRPKKAHFWKDLGALGSLSKNPIETLALKGFRVVRNDLSKVPPGGRARSLPKEPLLLELEELRQGTQ